MIGQVGLISDGVFADGVCSALERGLRASGVTSARHRLDPAVAPERRLAEADVTVLASDRYDRSLVDRWDVASHGTRRPWLAVVHQHPYVQLGPYVVPFKGACHACLRLRLTQHGGLDPVGERVASGAGLSPVDGLPPHLAATVAGLVLGMLLGAAPARGDSALLLVHVDGLAASRLPVTAAHFCRRCGAQPGHWPPTRDNAAIVAALPSPAGRR